MICNSIKILKSGNNLKVENQASEHEEIGERWAKWDTTSNGILLILKKFVTGYAKIPILFYQILILNSYTNNGFMKIGYIVRYGQGRPRY